MKIPTLLIGLALASIAMLAHAGDKPAPIELPAIHITAPAPVATVKPQTAPDELAGDQTDEKPSSNGLNSKPIIY